MNVSSPTKASGCGKVPSGLPYCRTVYCDPLVSHVRMAEARKNWPLVTELRYDQPGCEGSADLYHQPVYWKLLCLTIGFHLRNRMQTQPPKICGHDRAISERLVAGLVLQIAKMQGSTTTCRRFSHRSRYLPKEGKIFRDHLLYFCERTLRSDDGWRNLHSSVRTQTGHRERPAFATTEIHLQQELV